MRNSSLAGAVATLDRLSGLVIAHPTFDRGYYRIVVLGAASGQLNHVYGLLNSLPDTADTRPYVDYAWAVYFNRIQHWQEAEERAKRCATVRPSFTPAYAEWITAARRQGNLGELVPLLQQAIRENSSNEGARFGLALLALETQDPDEALRQLAPISTQTMELMEYSDILYRCLVQKRDPSGAIIVLERMLNIAVRRGDLEWIGNVLGRMGMANNDLGNIQQAREQLERCVTIARELGNRVTERIYAPNLGLAEYYLGNHSVALKHYRAALPMAQQSGDRRSAGRIIGLMAAAHAKTGDYSGAIDEYRKAASIAVAVKDFGSQADQMASLADIYLMAGDIARARHSIEAALVTAREMNNLWLEGRFVQVLGSIEAEAGKFDKAQASYVLAAQLLHDLGDQLGEAQARLRAGETQLRFKHFGDARKSYTAALEIGVRTASKTLIARAHAGLGEVFLRLGMHNRTLESFQTALLIGDETRTPELTFYAHVGLARLGAIQNEPLRAVQHYRAALDSAERMRSTLVSPEYKAGYMARKLDVYKEYTAYLLNLADHFRGSEYHKEAFAVAERGRARSYLDLITESQVSTQDGRPLAMSEGQRALHGKLSQLQGTLMSAMSAPRPDRSTIERLRTAMLQTDNDYQLASWEHRHDMQETRGIRDSKPAIVAEVQKTLGPNSIVLEYWLTESRCTLFAITRDQFQPFRLPDRRTINNEAAALRSLLASHPRRLAQGRLLELASNLFEQLVAPAALLMRGKHEVIVIPDGALHYLPFELLTETRRSRATGFNTAPYLVRERAIQYAPSASVLLALEQRREKPVSSHVLLAYGDPEYGSAGERDDHWSAPTWRSAGGSWPLKKLPESRREVEGLRTVYGHAGVVIRAGREATEESIKADPDLPEYHYIHFAAHGILNELRPHLSGIALTVPGKALEKPPEDGILHAYEVFHLRMQADVVVLSACETALGTEVSGEGLIGLTQAFLYAGASSVVATLWKVDDRAAAELMIRFHSHLSKYSPNPSDALRKAKLEMIRSGTWAHPHYWSGFTLTGLSRVSHSRL